MTVNDKTHDHAEHDRERAKEADAGAKTADAKAKAADAKAAADAQAITPEQATALLEGLGAIDSQIIAQNGGLPGTGLYQLLQLLARQFLGLPAPATPWTPTPPAA